MQEIILEISSFPITAVTCGVARCSRDRAAIKEKTQRKSDKNSRVKPLAKDIKPDATRTTSIAQSVMFKPRASIL